MISNDFIKGFEKTASPVLTDSIYGMDRSEHDDERQDILEKNTKPGSKAKKKDGAKNHRPDDANLGFSV